jgi:hypothetical protein
MVSFSGLMCLCSIVLIKKAHEDEEAKKITTNKSVPRTGNKNWLIFKY